MLRLLLAAVAIVACAWFVLGAGQARDINRATALLPAGGRVSPATGTRVAALLHSAGRLNPDRQVDLLRAQLADARGDRRQAERILRGVVAAEPLNADAWVALARSATDAATVRQAFRRLQELVPRVRGS